MVKQFFYIVVVSASLLFSTGIILHNNTMAQEAKNETPCYANRYYYVNIDCPEQCRNGVIDVSFDSKGEVNPDVSCPRCKILKQKKLANEYFVKIDCNSDGEADITLHLYFNDCAGNSCCKCTGRY